jgi:hypothetical protein
LGTLGAAHEAVGLFAVYAHPDHLRDQIAARARTLRAALPRDHAVSDVELETQASLDLVRELEPKRASSKASAEAALAAARQARREVEASAVRGARLVAMPTRVRYEAFTGKAITEEVDYQALLYREQLLTRLLAQTARLSASQILEHLKATEAAAGDDAVRLEEVAALDLVLETRLAGPAPATADVTALHTAKNETRQVAEAFTQLRQARLSEDDRRALGDWDTAIGELERDLSKARRAFYVTSKPLPPAA